MLLLCALVAGSSAWADTDPELTLDFTSAWTAGDDNSDGEKVFTKTVGETTYTIIGTGENNFKFNTGYFMFGKTNAYVKLPIVDFDVEKIEVIGNKGASAAVVHNIFVGSNAASTAVTGLAESTGDKNATTSSFSIGSSYQTAGTQYILKVTSSHNAQVTYIKYYKKTASSGNTVSTPSFLPAGGTYTTAQSIGISSTSGAIIHYTISTNGTAPADPTENDATFTANIPVNVSGTIIKAKAFKDGMTASSVASATYTIKPNKPIISAAGATVTISGDDGLTFYYTTDNSAPNNTSTEYTGPFDLSADCTIKAVAYDTYGNKSDVTTGFKYKYMPLSPKNINSGYYVKVTNVNDLENGDAILIVNEDGKAAMSTTQNSSNRGKEGIDFVTSGVIYAPSANVQRIVLVKKTESIKINDVNTDTDVFYFYTGEDGYLYASSSSSNQLKTETTPDDNNNARATIAISNGDATITFTGKATRNLLKFNSTNNPPIFSCYASGQSAVQIYKEVAHNESATVTSAEYATFVNSYALDFSSTGITAYTATDNETSVTLNEVVSGKVPANTPVILYKAGADGTAINVPVIASADAISGTNDLHAYDGTSTLTNAYVLANKTNGVGFYPWGGSTLSAGKVYLQAKDSYNARSFIGFDDVTAVESMNALPAIEGAYFNINGQRVAQPTKGLYIVSGHKVFVK